MAGRRDLQSKDEFFGLGALLEQSLLIDFDLKGGLNCIRRRRMGLLSSRYFIRKSLKSDMMI